MSREKEYSTPEVPIWEKYMLSIPEASKYFHIGTAKLRDLVAENPNADYVFWNGTRPQIKRKLFEKYLDDKLTAI